ncbi:DUF6363 domain-containing protein [Bifidobacterium sp. CLA-AA-H311]|uniref:DUF6363 domain-containing protein n=1 Tax=Bifidobacterium hominis TaxID=3133177 RepID=A0ABV1C9G3_9BIFI
MRTNCTVSAVAARSLIANARKCPQYARRVKKTAASENDEVVLAKEYEKDGRVLILAPESLYGLSTLSKSFEGLERMYRAGYAAAEAIPSFLES